MIDLNDSFIMSKDDFKDFLKILNFFSDMCNDLDVVDGKVFQRTNDRVAAIRCDLSNLIKFDGEITFCDIKKIVKNLKGLKKNSPIRFKRSGNSILVKDTTTSVFIPSGNQVYCDNKISQKLNLTLFSSQVKCYWKANWTKIYVNHLKNMPR